MLICENCGAVLEDDDLDTVEGLVGECWGQPAYETYAACPICRRIDLRDAHCEDCAHCQETDYGHRCDISGDEEAYPECDACGKFEMKEEVK